jgi:hypothetical protein
MSLAFRGETLNDGRVPRAAGGNPRLTALITHQARTGGRKWMTGSGGHDEPAPTLRFRLIPTILAGWARLLVPTTIAEGFAPGRTIGRRG